MQIISVIKAQGTSHFWFYSVLYYSYKVQNFDASWPPYRIYANKELSGMTDFHLIDFLENQH